MFWPCVFCASELHNHNIVAYMPKPNTDYQQLAVGSQKEGVGLSCSDDRCYRNNKEEDGTHAKNQQHDLLSWLPWLLLPPCRGRQCRAALHI